MLKLIALGVGREEGNVPPFRSLSCLRADVVHIFVDVLTNTALEAPLKCTNKNLLIITSAVTVNECGTGFYET